jgi:hypothetical protein
VQEQKVNKKRIVRFVVATAFCLYCVNRSNVMISRKYFEIDKAGRFRKGKNPFTRQRVRMEFLKKQRRKRGVHQKRGKNVKKNNAGMNFLFSQVVAAVVDFSLKKC